MKRIRHTRNSGMKRSFIAKSIGLADSTLHDRIEGTTPWKVDEAQSFCELLGLTKRQRDEIFFGNE